eukprot:4507920-Amphidinium_carterae.1
MKRTSTTVDSGTTIGGARPNLGGTNSSKEKGLSINLSVRRPRPILGRLHSTYLKRASKTPDSGTSSGATRPNLGGPRSFQGNGLFKHDQSSRPATTTLGSAAKLSKVGPSRPTRNVGRSFPTLKTAQPSRFPV